MTECTEWREIRAALRVRVLTCALLCRVLRAFLGPFRCVFWRKSCEQSCEQVVNGQTSSEGGG